MIDTDKAFLNFKKFFDGMTYDERENYLKKIGFVFDNDKTKLTKTHVSSGTRTLPKAIIRSFANRPQHIKRAITVLKNHKSARPIPVASKHNKSLLSKKES